MYLEKGEIPPVYIFLDRYSGSPIMNRGMNVFVKYIDGKYFYVSGTLNPRGISGALNPSGFKVPLNKRSLTKLKNLNQFLFLLIINL